MSEVRAALTRALTDAMRRRDRVTVSVCRTALAALANAEAVDLPDAPRAGAVELSAAGAGAADVPRRELSDDDVRAVLERDVADRREALRLADDEDWRQERLRELAVLESLLGGRGSGPG